MPTAVTALITHDQARRIRDSIVSAATNVSNCDMGIARLIELAANDPALLTLRNRILELRGSVRAIQGRSS